MQTKPNTPQLGLSYGAMTLLFSLLALAMFFLADERGLDVFQRFELNDAFNFPNRLQQHRQCKEFNVTYVQMK